MRYYVTMIESGHDPDIPYVLNEEKKRVVQQHWSAREEK